MAAVTRTGGSMDLRLCLIQGRYSGEKDKERNKKLEGKEKKKRE